MQDRGLAAYITELVGTLLLVFFITSVVVLYVASGANAQFGSDYAVNGLAQGFILAILIASMAAVSGGHFNPAVTVAAAIKRKIDPIDAVVYILAQLSGGVLGALLTKSLLLDEGRASDYGAVQASPLIAGNTQAFIVEAIGTFVLVMVILSVAFGKEPRSWAPFAIGFTLSLLIFVLAPLDGGSFNPARWFGPALVGNEWGGVWPYLAGPLVGAVAAWAFHGFVLEPKSGSPAPSGASTDQGVSKPPPPSGGSQPPPPPRPPQPPASPPGGIVGS